MNTESKPGMVSVELRKYEAMRQLICDLAASDQQTNSGLHLRKRANAIIAATPAPAVPQENADRPTLMFWMIEAHHERMPGPHPRWLTNRNTQETTQNVADAIKWENAFSAEVDRLRLRDIGGDSSHKFIVTEHRYLEPPK